MGKDFKQFIYKIRYPLLLLILLWIITPLNLFFDLGLTKFGIFPRVPVYLLSVFTGPLIHGSIGHLASNSLPILVLTSILVIFYPKVALKVFVSITIGTGLMVWTWARPSYHVGISGVIYGLIAFIFWIGIFRKNMKTIVLSLIVLIMYAGSVESIFPNVEENISWESHLFGGIFGILVAFAFRNTIEEDEKVYNKPPSWANEQEIKQYFLPRDAFEKTKMQRYYEYLEAQRLKQMEAMQSNYNERNNQ
ncbi:MAG: rhomboid family intramembrane serine protease [Chitinophagales bacterium]|nr:rhomboid family intramembrane serine protease [Chitinophagales bacterium]